MTPGSIIKKFLASLLSFAGLLGAGCPDPPEEGSPIRSLESLQAAIANKSWERAQFFFTDEIREQNSKNLLTEDFYDLRYWTSTRTVQALLPMPLLPEDARFPSSEIDGSSATVSIKYSHWVDKDMRLRSLTLEKQDRGWVVAEVFGRTTGSSREGGSG